ncbi:MAG: 23S rRNA (guanosine(2251)-2'-O)-methyltransferase RlmB [Sulfurimonadaceae bacterium]|jgi:23S rRNA (guanosine2251-2'-O)-methyltransferase|nr:23S rRNA (guanosine(2251)-2'-O)-methyltransferase RlmB [Sulfurimonadaceae bacterium]
MIIYAKQPVYYVLKNHPKKIKKLYLAKELDKKEYNHLLSFGVEVKRIPPNAAGVMCKNGNHQGFLAEVEEFKTQDYREFLNYDFVLLLSSLSDVGNIGSIVRSAYALGVDAIVVSGVKTLPFEAIARTSTGAIFDMPFALERNIHDVLNDFKTSGFRLYGASMDGVDVKKASFAKKKLLVLGSEGEGLTQKVSSKLDELLSIKMRHDFDSLNVGVAAAILIDRMVDE